ncbi:uncharacterized protein LOC111392853 [Olea europaea var. sylvestris]|uniref:uncharacterized protein LOC111392853 n=1 Tax=Olea europaea var. sylvestris TaxID=158386 RepID=UPI000C1D841F|nr:uncharacterized protein LOC111392853 [Olea europaea var. sylvestris]
MVYLHKCLINGSQSSLALVDRNCSYVQLVDTVMKEFDLDPMKVTVSLKYVLNDDLPPIRIKNNNNVLWYILLKDMEREPAKYPLFIDVTDTKIDNTSIIMSINAHSSGELCTLQDMASDICEASIKTMGHICDTEVTVVSVADAREVEEGRVFCEKNILKLSLSLFAIQNMFEFMVEMSDKKEYVLKCSHHGCSWICRSSKWGKTNIFKVRKIASHTCPSNIVLGSHRQVSTTVVSSTIKYKYTSSRTIYTSKDICNNMLHTYGVYLNYSKAWRSREQTLRMIRDDPTESFGKIPRFFYMLQQKNPGTVTELEVDSHNRFKYCFMTLRASIQGWEHCRPVVVVDGTYLNGHYRGTLFTACTQDANNSIYILAFGIGDNENDKSWRWFLKNFKKAYGHRDEYEYPRTSHGICTYHFFQNLKSYYGKSCENITQAFNSVVRAYTLEEFEYYIRGLDTMNEKIIGYLADVGLKKWSRIHMPANRYSTMTSNIVESVNAVTKAAKNYRIVSLLESLRQTVQSWFCKHRDDAHGTFMKLSSKYEKEMRKISVELRYLPPTSECFVILQVNLIPCPHALAVIANTRRDPYAYCSYYYTRDAYVNAYQYSIYPVGNQNERTVPEKVQAKIVLAPNQKRSSGRPTEKRKRSSREGKPTVKCGRCGG